MQRFKNILLVANPEGISDALVARAQWLAKANGAKLTLIDVFESSQNDLSRLLSVLPNKRADEISSQVKQTHQDALERIAVDLRADGMDVSVTVAQGVGFIEVIRHVLRNDNDLVIKAAEHSASWQMLAGPDLHLLRKCPCPVWVLNSATEPNTRRIVAAVDPDPEDTNRDALNNKVMQLATSLAVEDDARLDVLNAWHLYEEHLLRGSRVKTPEHEIDMLLERTRAESHERLKHLTNQYKEFDDRMHVLHLKGIPADVIAQHAEDERIDTLVMGTLGRTGLSGLFIGNTADTVLGRVNCSVLAVKPEGFISPVTLDDEGPA